MISMSNSRNVAWLPNVIDIVWREVLQDKYQPMILIECVVIIYAATVIDKTETILKFKSCKTCLVCSLTLLNLYDCIHDFIEVNKDTNLPKRVLDQYT